MSSQTSTPSAKEDKGCQQWTFTAGHILCCHCNYILDKRPDLLLQQLQSLKREPAKAPCELAKLVKHVCLEQFIGQLINSSLQPVHQYLYLIVVITKKVASTRLQRLLHGELSGSAFSDFTFIATETVSMKAGDLQTYLCAKMPIFHCFQYRPHCGNRHTLISTTL